MELVKLIQENTEKEHIFCAFSHNKDIQVMSQKKRGFLFDPKYMSYKGFQTGIF